MSCNTMNGNSSESFTLNRRPGIPILYTTGTFYQVGYDVGRTFSDRIKGYWTDSKSIQDFMVPYLETPEGKHYYETTLDVCKSVFPQYIREIEGIADGSGFPFKNLFALCLSKEIDTVLAPAMRRNETNNGCSDILVNRPDCKILGHTEDAHHVIDSYGYLVSARIVENDEEVESFTTYCYPGTIGGCAFSFNRHGMVFSCDGLYPSYVVENTPTRIMLNRAVIKSKNIDEAYEILKAVGHGVSYSFNINIVDVKNPSDMWSIEVGPQAGESLTHMHILHEEADGTKPCHYIHTNTIEHLKGVAEIPNMMSSLSRRERAKEMDPPKTREGVLAILGDVTNEDYPIFQTPKTPYGSATLFTAVVDVLENRVDFYRENPSKPGQRPLFHLQIKDGSN